LDEYAFACSGASFNLTLLAKYEEALRQAGECRRAREGLKDVRGIAKAMELEALALCYIGDYAAAESLVEQAKALISNQGFVGVGPRLDWLDARLASLSGNKSRAEELLAAAERVLATTQDWEDLPGVQIERQVLHSGLRDPEECLTRIWSIAHDPRFTRATAVRIGGGVAIVQILLDRGGDHAKFSGFISSCLELAEVAGMVESGWYLSYALGEFAEREGDSRGAQTRFGHAIRTLREISDALSADHRKLYLARPHTRSAVSRISRES
jgi:tetratricopeptide (TPR) repeat protein